MKTPTWFLGVCLLILGCGQPSVADPLATQTVAQPAGKSQSLPADLGTRKAGVDWPTFLGPTGDSKSTETGIIAPWPAEGPKIVWQTMLGTSYGMPVISRGRLFQFDRFEDRARLTCMESETGETLWEFEYPTDYQDMYGYNNGPRCSPVVDGDRVYIFGVEGMLHCLRVSDGSKVWQVNTQKDVGVIQNFFGVASTPVIEGDLLIVLIGGSPPDSERVPFDQLEGNGSGIVAFDKFTGQVKYRFSDELASYSVPKLATIASRRWCFVLARGGLLGFEPATGKLDFHYPWRAPILESVNASTPVVVDDKVFISECYGPGSSLLKVRPGGYDVVWADSENSREKSMQTHWNTAVYHEGYLYGSSGRHTNQAELRCIEFETGKVQWNHPGLGRASLLYVDGHFVCLCEDGELLLIKVNPKQFELVSHVVLPAPASQPVFPGSGPPRLLNYPAWAAPILSHGLLYARGERRLVCMELIPDKPAER